MLRITPESEACIARLGPYARHTLERAARFAWRLHAEEISTEHFIASLLFDESAGATRLVIAAFADPDTIAQQVLALCPGVLVVASRRSLPFSFQGVRALERARVLAAARRAAAVECTDLLQGAFEGLEQDLRSALEGAGLNPAKLAPEPAPDASGPGSGAAVPAEGPLFKHFSNTARRALGAACRAAGALGRDAISPAHLVWSALGAQTELGQRVGLCGSRAQMVLGGQDEDPSTPPQRTLAPDAPFLALLGELESGADTTVVLGQLLQRGSDELRLLAQQQTLTPKLCEDGRGRFADPNPPARIEHEAPREDRW